MSHRRRSTPSTACVTGALSLTGLGLGDPRDAPRRGPAADGEPPSTAGGATTSPSRDAVATRDKAGGLAAAFSLEPAGGGVPPLDAPALGDDCCDRACCGVRRGSSSGLMPNDVPGLGRSELVRRMIAFQSTAAADPAAGASRPSAGAAWRVTHGRSAANTRAHPTGQVSTSHRIGTRCGDPPPSGGGG